ncbi:hypothetical protein C2845_PM11G13220 [Panicum miliaceum]|uniref:RING-type domain-containing protein n=1 Tax=Panicum miliaceum TaxID=4540 RepID=A0A3L6RRI9_PANMI|nr:hypothetical protein C2845_PM11G13220 [Panicum miliaceum]
MDDVQGQYYLGPDSIIFLSAGSPIASSPRPARYDGMPPDSLLDAIFVSTLATWQATLAADDGERRARKRARVAATSEAILGLQEVAGDRRSGEECAICLKDFGAEETLRAMPCSHAFHQHCISQWLHRNPNCPLCRRRLQPTDDDVEEDEDDGEYEAAMLLREDEEEEDLEWEDGGVIVDESS